MKVYIVDDSDKVVEWLGSMLGEIRGIEMIGHADNASTALESIRKLKPDAVVLDIRLRSGNGIEVLCQIKRQDCPPFVIMLTNYPYPQYRKKCEELGADFFLDKSIEFDRVPVILSGLMDDHSEMRSDNSVTA